MRKEEMIQEVDYSGDTESRDSISNLPDALLCHILSFLPTKVAVRCSVLSTRWRYVWASCPTLDLEDEDEDALESCPSKPLLNSSSTFMNFVERIMLVSDISCMRSFRLRWRSPLSSASVNTWISAAIRRRVEKLHLELALEEAVRMPGMLFTSSKTLVMLRLEGSVALDVPTSVWFPKLKILHLKRVKYVNEEAAAAQEVLLLGCPVLEELVVERRESDKLWVFNVSAPALTTLEITFAGYGNSSVYEPQDLDYQLLIDAPNLEYLHLQDFVSDHYSINSNLSSLVKAFVNVRQDDNTVVKLDAYLHQVFELLRHISNVKHLSLGSSSLWYLSGDADYNNIPTFPNVTKLELNCDYNCWGSVENFLERSPNLQHLILVNETGNPHHPAKNCIVPRYGTTCLALHLKQIEIKNFTGKDDRLEIIIEYLLKNGRVLDKMTIYCGALHNHPEVHSLERILSKLPRGSPTCQLIFQ